MPGDLGRTRFLLLLHYSLWNVVFISWFHTAVHRPRLSSITHARAWVGTLHSSSSHHHFWENSLTDALNKKRIWRPQKKKNRSEPDKVSLSLPCAWPENSKFILFPGGWRPPWQFGKLFRLFPFWQRAWVGKINSTPPSVQKIWSHKLA